MVQVKSGSRLTSQKQRSTDKIRKEVSHYCNLKRLEYGIGNLRNFDHPIIRIYKREIFIEFLSFHHFKWIVFAWIKNKVNHSLLNFIIRLAWSVWNFSARNLLNRSIFKFKIGFFEFLTKRLFVKTEKIFIERIRTTEYKNNRTFSWFNCI